MFNLKTAQSDEVKAPQMPIQIPDTVYLKMVAPCDNLIARVVRAEDALGNRVGAGYISAVHETNGDRHAVVRLIINNEIYTGVLNWDETRYCKIDPAYTLEAIV